MNPEDIKKLHDLMMDAIDRYTKAIRYLRTICKHPNVEVKRRCGGSIGLITDSYWSEHMCSDCGAYWITEK